MESSTRSGAVKRQELGERILEPAQVRTAVGLLTGASGPLEPQRFGLPPDLVLLSWFKAAQITHGAVFRAVRPDGRVDVMPLSDRSIALIVQRRAKQAGLGRGPSAPTRCAQDF
jgi:hypothetical protein